MLGGMEIGMDTSNRRGSRDIIRAEFLSFIYWHWDVGAFEFSSLSFGTHCRLTNQPSHLTNRSKFWRADWNVLSVLNVFIFWCWTIFLFGKRMCPGGISIVRSCCCTVAVAVSSLYRIWVHNAIL